jgi:hypothetical protein
LRPARRRRRLIVSRHSPLKLGEGATNSAAVNHLQGGKKVFTLHTSCSPLLQQKEDNALPFPLQENWKYIGAKFITKSMSVEFDFDQAKEMRMTTCGTFEVEHE